jgi:hypothetical protein
VVPSDEDLPLPVEVQRLETELAETEQAIARLRAELDEANNAAGKVQALARGRRRTWPGVKGLGFGLLLGFLLALVAR